MEPREDRGSRPPVEAVIFDWGGTLTPWHDIDFDAEARALALAVVPGGLPGGPATHATGHATGHATALAAATQRVWARSRDQHRSATVADVFAEAGLAHDEERLGEYRAFWEPHTRTDPEAEPALRALRGAGLRTGVLSNTIWPRAWHEEWFARDGVGSLLDATVYSSEVRWTKPAPEAFRLAAERVGVEPARCVYVGDRLFEDVWGPQQVGMRAVHIPHSTIPAAQRGHSDGEPDAVVHRLAELPGILQRWL